MLNFGRSNSKNNIHHQKKSSYNPSLSLNNKIYSSLKEKKNGVGSIYTRKAVSLDKNSLFPKHYKNSANVSNTISANKQIQGKKLASSQSHYSSIKSGLNINTNYSCYLSNKDDSFSYIKPEKRTNLSQNKEGIIRELKTNYSQDKLRRKKILNVNTTDVSLGINDSNSHSFFAEGSQNVVSNASSTKNQVYLAKSTFLNSCSNYTPSNYKKDQPLKLYTDNVCVKNNNNNNHNFNNSNIFSNSILSNKNTFNTSIPSKQTKAINEIEEKMLKALKENKTNSKSKKYNVIRHSLDELIKILQGTPNANLTNLLHKMLVGYHEVVYAFSNENRELKEMNSKYLSQIESIKKAYVDTISVKDKEIETLKKQLTLNSEIISTGPGIPMSSGEKDQSQSHKNNSRALGPDNEDYFSNPSNEKIIALNKKNLCDLDALYFFDKVEMRPTKSASSTNIPILHIDNSGQEKTKNNTIANNHALNNNISTFNIIKQKFK